MTIDQQFVEFVIKSLVSKPEAVHIERRIDEKGVLLELSVDPEDLGRVIGKRGATAQSVRTLLRALGTKNEARYNLKIIDNGPGPSRDDGAAAPSSSDDGSFASDNSSSSDGDAAVTAADDTYAPSVSALSNDADEDDSFVSSSKKDSDKTRSESSDNFAQTRRELEELDDLDV